MIIERDNDEIVIRFSAGKNTTRIQTILNYLRYEELTSKSYVTPEKADLLVNEAKKDRWKKIKDELEIDE